MRPIGTDSINSLQAAIAAAKSRTLSEPQSVAKAEPAKRLPRQEGSVAAGALVNRLYGASEAKASSSAGKLGTRFDTYA